MNERTMSTPRFRRQPAWILLAGLLLAPHTGLAQLDASFTEVPVQSGDEAVTEERESTREQLEEQEQVTSRWIRDDLDIAQLERIGQAMSRLRDLVDSASRGSERRADYMFRLAELYYTQGRLYEQRSFERGDQAFEFAETNPERARQLERLGEADLEEADQSALQAIEVYVELYQSYHDTFPDMDGVLFFLGSTLSQLGRVEDALDFFEELANDFPSSRYLPQALLAFGEYHFFIINDMEEAQLYYQAVGQFPDATVYPYALYQEAWCFYNTVDYEQAMQRLLDSIEASENQASSSRMRRRALNDLALFYVNIGNAENVFPFFEAIAPDLATELVTLVAGVFGDDGNFVEANGIYRELMARNPDSFEVVNWQAEIVRNTLPSQDEERIVREMRRLVELFSVAQTFADATPESIEAGRERIERQVRVLATTYHRDAQVLNNDNTYALAYNLYQDYAEFFLMEADPETSYTMAFYYGELLFRNERFDEAAYFWELCLELNPEGEYNEEAIYKAVVAWTKHIDMQEEMEINEVNVEDFQEVRTEAEIVRPVPQPIPDTYQRLLRACDRYLSLDPPDEFAVEVEFLAARVLYEHAHLDEVIDRFGRIAMDFYDLDTERAQASAELLLDSLGALYDVERMEHWISTFRNSPLNRGEFADRLNTLGQQIGFTRCRALQVDGEPEQAGHCFFEFFAEFQDSDLVDEALYNAALAFEAADLVAEAIQVREYLIQFRPDAEVVPETMFTLGRAYHRLAIYRDAAQWYETYAGSYPEEEQAVEAMANAAIFRQGLGDLDEAIDDYERFMELPEADDSQQAQAFFQIGAIYEQRDQEREAQRQYRRYLDREADSGAPGLAIEASTRLGVMDWDNNDREEAESQFLTSLDIFNALTDEERGSLGAQSLDAAAQARFMLGEGIFEQFLAVPVRGNPEQVQISLREKLAIGTQAREVYEQVRAFTRPGWSIAAFTRLGELYHQFYLAVVNAPVPENLSMEVEEAYLTLLEESATEVRLQAVENYNVALRIAQTSGWFNEYSALAEQNLAELDPSFRAGNEIRARPGFEPVGTYATNFHEQAVEEEEEAETPLDGNDDSDTDATDVEPVSEGAGPAQAASGTDDVASEIAQ